MKKPKQVVYVLEIWYPGYKEPTRETYDTIKEAKINGADMVEYNPNCEVRIIKYVLPD